MLKTFEFSACADGSLGLDLSRAPWDPYPWISNIRNESNAYSAGLRIGDTLLELNGYNVLGLRIREIAELLKCCQQKESAIEANPVQDVSTNWQELASSGHVSTPTIVLIWRYNDSFNNQNPSVPEKEPQRNNAVSLRTLIERKNLVLLLFNCLMR